MTFKLRDHVRIVSIHHSHAVELELEPKYVGLTGQIIHDPEEDEPESGPMLGVWLVQVRGGTTYVHECDLEPEGAARDTMRDHFAGLAMRAIASAYAVEDPICRRLLAERSYLIADDMIAARCAKPSPADD